MAVSWTLDLVVVSKADLVVVSWTLDPVVVSKLDLVVLSKPDARPGGSK